MRQLLKKIFLISSFLLLSAYGFSDNITTCPPVNTLKVIPLLNHPEYVFVVSSFPPGWKSESAIFAKDFASTTFMSASLNMYYGGATHFTCDYQIGPTSSYGIAPNIPLVAIEISKLSPPTWNKFFGGLACNQSSTLCPFTYN